MTGHTDPVCQLKWVVRRTERFERFETLISISNDGNVLEWNTKKGTLPPLPSFPSPLPSFPSLHTLHIRQRTIINSSINYFILRLLTIHDPFTHTHPPQPIHHNPSTTTHHSQPILLILLALRLRCLDPYAIKTCGYG